MIGHQRPCPMNFGGMPGDGESQISHGKWMEKEIRRIRICWDEFLINPAPRFAGRRILTTGAGVSDRTLKALRARSDRSAAPT